MSSKDQLVELGFEVAHSSPSPVKYWGKWFVGLKHPSGRMVNGYGDDEEAAFANALTIVNTPRENSSTNKHG